MNKVDQSTEPLDKTRLPFEREAITHQLDRILACPSFQKSRRLTDFLRFVVEETLADRALFIKARTVAIGVFDRDPADSPDNDPIVRIHAGRLRRALSQYYESVGTEDPIKIEIPKGSYVPKFSQINNQGLSRLSSTDGSSTGNHRIPRIAVLPFVNLDDSSSHEYFADGLAEELSAQLARFRGLAVLAYWTTSQIRGTERDVLNAVRELGVDFFVCGSIARSGDRIRVSIQCVQVDTGDQNWTQRFDRKITVEDLFDVQDKIVQQVVSCVADDYGSISGNLYQASRDKSVADLTAYEAVLSNHHYLRFLDQQAHNHTRAALEHAVEIEPAYGLAWAMLGALYCDIHAFNMSHLDSPLARADDCVRRALRLDQNLQHAHYASAYVATLSKDPPQVINACENIVRLNSNSAFMVGASSIWLGIAGRFDQAFALLERSLELNPYFPGWFHFLPWLREFSNQKYETALDAAQQFNMPTFFIDPMLRAATLGRLGRLPEAQLAFQELVNLCPDFVERHDHYIGCLIHSENTRDDTIDGLQSAGLIHS